MARANRPNEDDLNERSRPRQRASSLRQATVLMAVLAVGVATFLVTSSGARSSGQLRTRNVDARFSADASAATNQYQSTQSPGTPSTGSGTGTPSKGSGTGTPNKGGNTSTPSGTGTPSNTGTPGSSTPGSTPGTSAPATTAGLNVSSGCSTTIQQSYASLAYRPGNLFTAQLTSAEIQAYAFEVKAAGKNASWNVSCPEVVNVSTTGWGQVKFVCVQTSPCTDQGDLQTTIPQTIGNVTKLRTYTIDPTLFTIRAGKLGKVWVHLNAKGRLLMKIAPNVGSKLIVRGQTGTHKVVGRVIVVLHATGKSFGPPHGHAPSIYG
jgi:hypothetical protein